VFRKHDAAPGSQTRPGGSTPFATCADGCIPAAAEKQIDNGANRYCVQASTNYKEAFSLFDTRGVGRVVLDKLGDLLRACGQNPTLAEIRDLEASVGGDCE
jgi:hypothetical protein